MPRPEKVQAVEEIAQRFEDANAVFLTEYRGLSVAEQQALRRELRSAGASYKVLKMSLARRAVADRPEQELAKWLLGPTAIAFVAGDPVPAAKALAQFANDHGALVVKAGALAGEVLPPEMVAKLATIEPREVLLAKIAGAAKAPLAQLAGMLGSFTRDAASVFAQLLEKKEPEAPAEAAPEDAPAAPADDTDAAGSAEEAAAAVDAEAVAEPESPDSAESPASPASSESPASPESPDSPDSPEPDDDDDDDGDGAAAAEEE